MPSFTSPLRLWAARQARERVFGDDDERAGKELGDRVLEERGTEFTRALALKLLIGDVTRITVERDGVLWTTDLGDAVGRDLYQRGGYQQAEIEAVLRWLQQSGRTGTVVDVGANVGTTSVVFALAGYDVLAIEPVPETYEMLRENADRNQLEITCVQTAITDRVGHVQMWTGAGSGQGEVAVEGHEPAATRWGSAGTVVDVPSAPLSEVVHAHASSIALVWADVQGSETSVLRTGHDLWAGGVPLYLEVDPFALDLHGGFAAFLEQVTSHFRSFIPRDGLLAGDHTGRPIASFEPWARAMSTPREYSDALLIP